MEIIENKVYRLKGKEGYFVYPRYEEGMGWNVIDIVLLQPVLSNWLGEEEFREFAEASLEYVDKLEVFI